MLFYIGISDQPSNRLCREDYLYEKFKIILTNLKIIQVEWFLSAKCV